MIYGVWAGQLHYPYSISRRFWYKNREIRFSIRWDLAIKLWWAAGENLYSQRWQFPAIDSVSYESRSANHKLQLTVHSSQVTSS